jgi:hypothetical protein
MVLGAGFLGEDGVFLLINNYDMQTQLPTLTTAINHFRINLKEMERKKF